MRGASADVPLSTVITGLEPNTTYRWVFCGSPNNGADYACVGPNGKGGSTTADPPPDFETFTTPPFEALAESWDGTSWAIRPTPNPTDARGDSDLSGTPARPPRHAPPSGQLQRRPRGDAGPALERHRLDRPIHPQPD